MSSALHQLCPRYSGTLTPTAPTASRLWETFTFTTKYVKTFQLHLLNFILYSLKIEPNEKNTKDSKKKKKIHRGSYTWSFHMKFMNLTEGSVSFINFI